MSGSSFLLKMIGLDLALMDELPFNPILRRQSGELDKLVPPPVPPMVARFGIILGVLGADIECGSIDSDGDDDTVADGADLDGVSTAAGVEDESAKCCCAVIESAGVIAVCCCC
jgi:hypothetical protein